MATKIARLNGPHSAGIFADMTIDGPEIGTLVLIVDRAKNLPNKKTMGKQSAYCAARLGKEAQKTETDKRGGQTPRWDQELRFTVHDSPDYYNLKISVFSEDKRTDLVGEAWVNLNDVIVPGGGKNDLWQGLNCKGKYAGELRIELTYYDSRQKPEKVVEATTIEEDIRPESGSSKVKRRPLPQNPNIPSTTPVVIPERPLPGRARHGPRDFHMPQRPVSMPPQELSYPHSQTTLMVQKPVHEVLTSASAPPIEQTPPKQYFEESQQTFPMDHHITQRKSISQPPDSLSQLDSTSRRASTMAPRQYQEPMQAALQAPVHRAPPPQSHNAGLPHSYSAPSVPVVRPDHHGYEDMYQVPNEYQERSPHNEQQYRHNHAQVSTTPLNWNHEHSEPYSDKQVYAEETELAPPPPPVHSNSAPAVPHYSPQHTQLQHPSRYEATPPRSNQQYIPNASPLEGVERTYVMPQQIHQQQQQTPSPSHHHYHHHLNHSGRDPTMDNLDRSPAHHGYTGTPPDLSPVPTSSPYDRAPATHHIPPQHNSAEPYTAILRPHPLSQEVPRTRVPDHYNHEQQSGSAAYSYSQEPRERRSWVQDTPPLIKPRAISPSPLPMSSAPRPHQPTLPHHPSPSLHEQQPQQKSFKPRNSYSIQFPVRAFESSDENPLVTSRNSAPQAVPARKSVSPRPSMGGNSSSSTPFSPDSFDVHNPGYQVQPGSSASPTATRDEPIVDWDGNEIHPSDHLPVDSWAPEPEQKTPSKTYGLGRDRDFGPRAPQGVPTSTGRVSKDTIINFRRKKDIEKPGMPPAAPPVRNGRLQKPRPDQSHAEPPRDRGDYDRGNYPYSQARYSRSFTEDMPDMNADREYYGPPSIPPKLPIQPPEYDRDALSREIATIDIGSSRNRLSQSAVAFVPVRSHRDRNSFY